MFDSSPTTQPEIELLPAAASPLNTVAMAESMHRKYGLATPVSGTRTARMHLREFQRTAQLMIEAAHDVGATITRLEAATAEASRLAQETYARHFAAESDKWDCPACRWDIRGFWTSLCEVHA